MPKSDQLSPVYSLPSQDERYRAPERFLEYIQKGYIELGMTKDEVKASWGEPKLIKLKTSRDYDEEWVYIPNWKFRDKLYFSKGILVRTTPDYLVVSRMEGHGLLP